MKQVDHDYYKWLIKQIEIHGKNKTFFDLFEVMHNTEFTWFVPNDDNRVHDGLDLRTEFLYGTHGAPSHEVLQYRLMTKKGATFLEVLIALSRRCAFIAGGEPQFWAWKLIENLHLNNMNDPLTDRKLAKVISILDAVIWRTYEKDGEGGFFPLNWPKEDQTKVEIWYQMNKYVIEIQEEIL